MSTTKVSIQGTSFLFNGRPVYSEIRGSRPESHGLLMNARFIQGVFDDKADPSRFARFGQNSWDPEAHTDALIAALPDWYRYGLRAFTVGFQGGGPCFTIDNTTIDNNPFGADGKSLDPRYASRMERLILAADKLGMVVIVSFFYGQQVARIPTGQGVRNAVQTGCRFLRDRKFTNVIIEVANEYDIPPFRSHPLLQEAEGMAWLIDFARQESGGMLVGSSGGGGTRQRQVVEASDVVLIHGNGQSRQQVFNMIRDIRTWAPEKPIVCNEDSQALSQMPVFASLGTSWGYYNNLTKQEPPVQWGILPGEDRFFAHRTAEIVGIATPPLAEDEQYYLQGFEPEMTANKLRWPRLASLYPEKIDHVDFYRDGVLYDSCWDDPFTVHFKSNWLQGGVETKTGEVWTAKILLRDGRMLQKEAVCP